MSEGRAGIFAKFALAGITHRDVERYLEACGRSWLTDADAARYEAERRDVVALRARVAEMEGDAVEEVRRLFDLAATRRDERLSLVVEDRFRRATLYGEIRPMQLEQPAAGVSRPGDGGESG